MKCTFALTLEVLFSILPLSAAFLPLGRKVHERRWCTCTRFEVQNKQKDFSENKQGKEKKSRVWEVLRVIAKLESRDIEIFKTYGKKKKKKYKGNWYGVSFNYDHEPLSHFVFVNKV